MRHRRMGHHFPVFIWIDIGLFLLSLFLFILTFDYPQMAGTFPQLVLIMIMVVVTLDVGVGLRIRAREDAAENPREAESGGGSKAKLRVLLTAVLMFVFFYFMVLFGVVFGTFLFILLAGWTLGYRKLKVLLISSAIVSASVHVIFTVIMKSFLPEGIIFRVIGG